ncbi:acetate--CoA ligase family protein [Cryptosporangium aurantiacum]|uniref:Acyl-CoA synthetase (NDP forming) n=1 Tax=Cryptosporangium aurantiacum TaxID=134849 RepID=A0A1M7R3R3_9ACTN|nr:acetate--CoA ligase family protein [Cryptosporangium aurantiacum]SHN39758.1 Acyl-CoA synthetase (NDP forming) [Cryptosporangium aurantiacum]
MTVAPPLSGAELARALFAPRSVALIGASSDPVKASSRPLRYLRRDGFAGAVYPVNRRGGVIGGEPVHRTLAELPEVPEHAFLMTPTAATVAAVRECGEAGVRLATVLSGGFGENGPTGRERERALRETAAAYGVRLLGPNSLGVVNPRRRLALTANAAFSEPDLPVGGTMVASQSGSLLGALMSRSRGRGTGFSRMVSVGAEADLSLGEICAATVADDDVTGYLLFLESLRHADRLRAFAIAAAAEGKPVVAYKLGRSRVGAELALSHTGALAGEDDVATAFLADCGIARISTLDGLLEALPLLDAVPARRAGERPRRVGVVTTTGGGAAMVVDQIGVRGVPLATVSAATHARLTAAGVAAEPGPIVDLTLAGTRPEIMGAALDVLRTAPEIDLLVAVIGSSARSQPELATTPLVDRAGRPGCPLAVFVVPEAPDASAMLAATGLPVSRTPESCADVVAAALGRTAPTPRTVPTAAVPGPARLLDEAASYARIAALGVPVAPFRVVPVGAVAPEDLAFPVAVKALSAALPHKSDVGGVVLGVGSPADVRTASRRVAADVAAGAGVQIHEVLVQEMRPALGEVLVGYRVDPEAGPMVLVAAGGVLAELLRDRAVRMAPVDRETALEMLDEVVSLGVLRGFRGAPRGDLGALADVVVALSRLAEDAGVVTAELNPVLVGATGVTAVDAVVHCVDDSSNDRQEDR